MTYADDYDATGRWKVTLKNLENSDLYSEVYDAIAIATGHHHSPLMPQFEGQHLFKGQISHSHEFKSASGFEGKRVVVLGSGNSGCDTAVELASYSGDSGNSYSGVSQVYLASRRGVWVRKRAGLGGRPLDVAMATRLNSLVMSWLPQSLLDYVLEYYSSLNFDHQLYGLKPKHR